MSMSTLFPISGRLALLINNPTGHFSIIHLLILSIIWKGTTWKTSCRWMDNFKIDHQGVGWGSMEWIALAQGRDNMAGTCKYSNAPPGSS